MSQDLQSQAAELRIKIADLDTWITNHHDHPDRSKIVSDRNHFSIKLKTIEFKIENLKNGEPLLGYGHIPQRVFKPEENKKTHR